MFKPASIETWRGISSRPKKNFVACDYNYRYILGK